MQRILSKLQALKLVLQPDGTIEEVENFSEQLWTHVRAGTSLQEYLASEEWQALQPILQHCLEESLPVAFEFTDKRGMHCYGVATADQRRISTLIFPVQFLHLPDEPSLAVYRRIFDLVPLNIVIFDTDHRYRYVSPSAIQDPEIRRWIIGKTDFDWVRHYKRPIEIAERRHQYFQQVLQTKQSVSWQEQIATADGRNRYFARFFHPLLNPQGHIEWVVGYSVELTELVEHQQKLQESEERFRTLVEYAPIPVLIHSEGKIVYCNPSAAQTLGFSHPEDVIGRSPFEFIHPESLAIAKQRIAAVYSEQQIAPQIEEKLVRADGTVITAIVMATPVRWQNKPASQVVFYDITEQKKLIQQLEQQTTKLQTVLDTIPVGIIVLDAQQRIHTLNPVAKTLLGIPEEQLQQCTLWPDPDRKLPKFLNIIFHHRQTATTELLYHSYDHKRSFYVRLWGSPILDAEGKVSEAVIAMEDISEQKQLEYQLRKLNQELEQKVDQRTEQLQQLLDKFKLALLKEQEVNTIKSRFISLVSHEFRTPLTGILSSVEILLRYDDRLTPEQRTEHLKRIQHLGQQLNELLDEIRHLGKVESGHYQPQPAPLQVSELIEEIIQTLHPTYPSHRIQCTYDPDPMPMLLLDKVMLRHVIQNLLSNALKYSPPESTVTIQVRYRDNQLQLTVCDEGIGIPQADLPHIFEPFHRASNAVLVEGTGLGLAITKWLVTTCNGTIRVESEEGKGSCFEVRLPIKQEASQPSVLPQTNPE